MKPEKTAATLENLCKEYGERNSAKDIYCYTEKGVMRCRINLGNILTEFVYSVKGSEFYPVSTLSCRVYPDPDGLYFFDIQELIDYLDIFDFHCYCFPYIENEKRLKACFEYITDFLDYRRDEILTVCERSEEFTERKIEEIRRVFGFNDDDAAPDKASRAMFFGNIFIHYSEFLVRRYTVEEAYGEFLNGNYDKAVELYDAIGEKTGYEEKLYGFIEERYAPYQAIPEECASIFEFKKYQKPDIKSFVLTVILSTVIFCALFILIQAVTNAYFLSQMQFAKVANPFTAAAYGVIPGVIGAIAFRKWLEPLTRKNKKEADDFYDLLENRKNTKRGFIITAALFLISLTVFLGLCRPPLYVSEKNIHFKNENTVFSRYREYPLEEFEETIIVEGYYADHNYTQYVVHPSTIYVFSGRRIVKAEKFNLSKEETEKLTNTLAPGMEHYKTKSIPAIEDLV